MKKVFAILSFLAISSTVFASGNETMPTSGEAKSAVCLIKEYFRQYDELTVMLSHIERLLVEATSIEERNELRLRYLNADTELSSLRTTRRNFLSDRPDNASDQDFYTSAQKYYPELAKQCNF